MKFGVRTSGYLNECDYRKKNVLLGILGAETENKVD